MKRMKRGERSNAEEVLSKESEFVVSPRVHSTAYTLLRYRGKFHILGSILFDSSVSFVASISDSYWCEDAGST